jgi:hypothetical protein
MVVSGATVRGLVNAVSEVMLEGWVPQGSMVVDRPMTHEVVPIRWARPEEYEGRKFFVAETAGPPSYYQAMVRP